MHARTHARTHACAHAHKHTRTHARSRHAHHESRHPRIVACTTRLHCHSRFTRYTRQRVHKLQKSRPRRLSFKMHTQTVHLRAPRCATRQDTLMSLSNQHRVTFVLPDSIETLAYSRSSFPSPSGSCSPSSAPSSPLPRSPSFSPVLSWRAPEGSQKIEFHARDC